MIYFGRQRPGSTLYIGFDTFAGSTGASMTMTGFATSDIKVYKDGSTTERASTSGYTLLDTDGIDFDGITGIHGFSIDLSDNTTADFWACGSRYLVVVSTITVDGQTLSFIAAQFRIGYESSILDTTIATLTTQTSFTLTNGPDEAGALIGCLLVIHDQASAVQQSLSTITAYAASTKAVVLLTAPTFTIAAKDNVSVFLPALQPIIPGRSVDIDVNGIIQSNIMQLNGSFPALSLLAASVLGIYSGTITGASPTTTTLVDSALGGKAVDFYKNGVLLFTSGAQAKQRVQITGYATNNTLTFTALSGAPIQGDAFVIL